MNKEDIKFIQQTETYRLHSTACIFLSILFLIIHEVRFLNNFINWKPSSTIVIGLALFAIAFRVIAIDRFLRMVHQQNYNEKHPDI